MDIADLQAVLVPPHDPAETGSPEEWLRVERTLGTVLPSAYKEFVSTYGTGAINNFFWVLNPFAEDSAINLLSEGQRIREVYAAKRAEYPQYWPFRVFPEAGGLLPWAFDRNGDELHWLTQGDPEHWHIIVYGPREPTYHEYTQPVPEFLLGVLTRRLVCPEFPDVFLWIPPRFLKVEELSQYGWTSPAQE